MLQIYKFIVDKKTKGRSFMLFFCLMLATTVSLAQNGAKITIKKNSISVIEALKEVEKQSGMSVGYNDSQLKNKPAITLNIEAASLENALAQILKGTGFTYQLKEKYIMIIPEQKKESNPTKKITGKVVDENNDPLIGVNIKVEGTAAGSITDIDGNFLIEASTGNTLTFTYIGYTSESIKVTNQNNYRIQLTADTQQLSEVVVTALGIKREQKALSYNVQQIGADKMPEIKDANFINSLSGKAAGVVINASSSGVGGASKVVMRGTKSIEQSSNALYVIDGIPMYNFGGGGGTEFDSKGATEAIADINPDDIESISFLTGADKNQTFFSAAAVNSEGMIPNNRYNRYNFTFRNTTHFLNDKMKLDVGASYIIQNDRNMTNQGVYSNPLVSAYLFPRGDDFSLVKAFERYDEARKINVAYWPQGEGDLRMQNPYWIAYRNVRTNEKKRYMLNAGLTYDILDWLNVSARIRVDNTDNTYQQKLYASTISTLTEGSTQGHYTIQKVNETQTYADFMVNINKRIDDFTVVVNAGTSLSDNSSDLLGYGGPIRDTGVPNVFNVFDLDNAKKRATQEGSEEMTQSIFASAEIGWKSMLYLTLTGRNDWASQLKGSNPTSFFYPSVGLSAVISEMVTLPKAIDYLKVRGSFSSVGTPYPRFLVQPTYSYDPTKQDWNAKTHYPIGKLKPERTDSWEIGVDGTFFKDFKVSGSFYYANTYNQTFDPKITVSSGYSTLYVQTGYVRNLGVEGLLSYGHTWRDFGWNSNFTFSWNKNKIVELVKDYVHPETGEIVNKDRLELKGLGYTKFILKEGGTLGDLYTNADFIRDDKGYIQIDKNGDVAKTDNLPDIKLGSVFPKANLAWNNSFSYKGIYAGFQLSARLGGIVYSATQAALDQYGVSEASAAARDRGGVLVNGRSWVNAQQYYEIVATSSGLPQYYTYSATNLRLQEAHIGYTIPRKWLGNICDINVSVVGRNLWMIYCKAPFDPEAIATTNNFYQGIDYFMMPSTRNFGFNVKINF